MTTTIDIDRPDGPGTFTAYCAEPAGAPKAAVVVIQEIFGVNAGIRRRCDMLAEAGYLAIAPDLFWRIEANVELDPDIPPEMERSLELMNKFDQDQGIADIQASLKAARTRLGQGKVGVLGYCLGGRLAFMTAARTDADATVCYYGVGIDGLLDEAKGITHPVMLHMGQDDHFVDKAAQARMHAGLNGHPLATLHDYAGADHGFATEFGKRRVDAAATLADRRTAEFFTKNLA